MKSRQCRRSTAGTYRRQPCNGDAGVRATPPNQAPPHASHRRKSPPESTAAPPGRHLQHAVPSCFALPPAAGYQSALRSPTAPSRKPIQPASYASFFACLPGFTAAAAAILLVGRVLAWLRALAPDRFGARDLLATGAIASVTSASIGAGTLLRETAAAVTKSKATTMGLTIEVPASAITRLAGAQLLPSSAMSYSSPGSIRM